MRFLHSTIVTGFLLASSAHAVEPGPATADLVRRTMREAMLQQVSLPARPAELPSMKPDRGAPAPARVVPEKSKGDALQHKAMGVGMRDANAMRAEMANRAARGGAMGTMHQTTGDMMNAPMMQRAQGMDPGGGMMPSGGTSGMGPGGMGTGGTGPGGMGPGGMGGGGGMAPPAGGR